MTKKILTVPLRAEQLGYQTQGEQSGGSTACTAHQLHYKRQGTMALLSLGPCQAILQAERQTLLAWDATAKWRRLLSSVGWRAQSLGDRGR